MAIPGAWSKNERSVRYGCVAFPAVPRLMEPATCTMPESVKTTRSRMNRSSVCFGPGEVGIGTRVLAIDVKPTLKTGCQKSPQKPG